MRNLFRGLIVATTLIYVAYFFLPYIDWYWSWHSQDTIELLQFSGYGAQLTVPIIVDYILFAAWLLTAIGMFFFIRLARSAFIVLYVVTTLIGLFSGLLVQTGLDSTLLSLSALLDGAIIAIAYLTPVEGIFSQDTTKLA